MSLVKFIAWWTNGQSQSLLFRLIVKTELIRSLSLVQIGLQEERCESRNCSELLSLSSEN
jgi:hypothetical protein